MSSSSSSTQIREIKVPKNNRDKALKRANKGLPEHLPKLTYNWLILAPRGSGKSTFVCNLLLGGYAKRFHKIFIFSPTYHSDPLWKSIDIKNGRVYDQGYSDKALRELEAEQLQHCSPDAPMHEQQLSLIIFDDILGQIKQGSFVNQFITRSRHSGCSCIFTSQTARSLPVPIRLNTTAFTIMNACSEEMMRKLDDVIDEETMSMVRALKKADVSRYNFTFYDSNADRRTYNFDDVITP